MKITGLKTVPSIKLELQKSLQIFHKWKYNRGIGDSALTEHFNGELVSLTLGQEI